MLPDGGATIELAISAVQKIFSSYGGYKRGKLSQSDQALREEVGRRTRMVREHLDAVHDKAHRKRLRELRSELKEAMETCNAIDDDARFSTSSTPEVSHDAQVKLTKKVLKQIVEHDLDTLEKLVKVTNAANQVENDIAEGLEESELVRQVSGVRQSLIGVRNHFRERNMIFDGYTKK